MGLVKTCAALISTVKISPLLCPSASEEVEDVVIDEERDLRDKTEDHKSKESGRENRGNVEYSNSTTESALKHHFNGLRIGGPQSGKISC